MNELFQLSPILPVETVDIFAVDGGKTGVSQSTCLRRGGSFRPFVAAERSASWGGLSAPDPYLVTLITANLGWVATFDRRNNNVRSWHFSEVTGRTGEPSKNSSRPLKNCVCLASDLDFDSAGRLGSDC